jgi:hypothetical protein
MGGGCRGSTKVSPEPVIHYYSTAFRWPTPDRPNGHPGFGCLHGKYTILFPGPLMKYGRASKRKRNQPKCGVAVATVVVG